MAKPVAERCGSMTVWQGQAAAPLPSPELHTQVQARWHVFGRERVPVLQLDDCLAAPKAWRQFARTAAFTAEAQGFYPGVRCHLPLALGRELMAQMARANADGQNLQPHSPLSAQCETRAACLSLATTPARQLRPIQSVPHFDDVAEEQWAVLIYLCDARHGGTGFYRHLSTGFERIGADRLPGYAPTLKREVMARPELLHRYTHDANSLFSTIGYVEAAFNRALVYPSNCLHSGWIHNDGPLYADVDRGRLTANFLFRVTQRSLHD